MDRKKNEEEREEEEKKAVNVLVAWTVNPAVDLAAVGPHA